MSSEESKMIEMGFSLLGGELAKGGGKWWKGHACYGATYGIDAKTGDYYFHCKTENTVLNICSKQPITAEQIKILEGICHAKTGSIYYPSLNSGTRASSSFLEDWQDVS